MLRNDVAKSRTLGSFSLYFFYKIHFLLLSYLFLKLLEARISENLWDLSLACWRYGTNQRGDGKRCYQASQKLMRRIRTRVVKTSQGIMTTSTLILRTAGMSLSTFGSRSKNRCRFRKIYAPPNKLTMKKNVAAIRKAGRTEGLICASMISVLSFAPLFSQASKAGHFTHSQI